jgi:hypothetical protein
VIKRSFEEFTLSLSYAKVMSGYQLCEDLYG